MKEIIALSTKKVMLKRNELLKMGGSVDTNVYFVESGSLRVFLLDGEEEQTIRFGYKDSLIVALDSFLTDKSSAFYIQAIKKSVIRIVTKSQFSDFVEQEENRRIYTSILENLVLQQLDRELDILTSSPLERYQRVLQRSPQLFQEIPKRYIANYLRMSPETLSRLKKS